MDTKLDTFGKRLQQARNASQYSRPQLAEVTGIPAKAIEKFEYGTQEPTFSRVETLAKTLNVTVDYLMKGDADEGQGESEIESITATEVQQEIIGDEHNNVSAKLMYLDELREIGFQKHWRTTPRLFSEVEEGLESFSYDELLDLGEERGLYPIFSNAEQAFDVLKAKDQKAILSDLRERIIDTAYFGRDLYYIDIDDLKEQASFLELKKDKEGAFFDSWSGPEAVIMAIRIECRDLALKGKAPDFSDTEIFKDKEVA